MSVKPGFRLKNVLVLEERSSSLNEVSTHRLGWRDGVEYYSRKRYQKEAGREKVNCVLTLSQTPAIRRYMLSLLQRKYYSLV